MSAFDAALAVYASESCAREFHEDFLAHLQVGYVISTPTAFAMWRPVMREWDIDRLRDPWQVAPVETADSWWIWLSAGDIREAWAAGIALVTSQGIDPMKISVAFERRNNPKWYRLKRLHQLCTTTPTS